MHGLLAAFDIRRTSGVMCNMSFTHVTCYVTHQADVRGDV